MLTGKNRTQNLFAIIRPVANLRPQDNHSALRYLWARERIKYLDHLVKSDNGRGDSTTIKEITRLGLKYNLMTNYTSFVAVDERIVNKDGNDHPVQQRRYHCHKACPTVPWEKKNEMNAVTRGAIGCYSARGNECAESTRFSPISIHLMKRKAARCLTWWNRCRRSQWKCG